MILKIIEHKLFSTIIITLILINAILVGLETYPYLHDQYGLWFHWADIILLWLFTIEIILRLIATKPTLTFFKDSWNVFDFIIVLSGHLFVGAHFITVLRILRVLRVLRAISVIPSLRKIVNALLLTIPALGNISLLLGLLFYIFAVLGTMLFAHIAPEYFGSLHSTLLTLFQVVTLESWASGVMRPLLVEAPWAWLYFVAFILVGTFVIFNLFVGVIVGNVEKVEKLEQEHEGKMAELHRQRKIWLISSRKC
ncbi:ion transporter [Caldalkalibacillus mannanilyticus]|uniref:ion transporter n=1 Tax=Caldalkalibacillus mannanilyticus TaxID=1418 RepID=UPI000A739889